MAGERRWQAFVNAAASGDRADYPLRDDLPHPVLTYPKLMAQLEHTTADVEYMSQWWKNDPMYPPLHGETSIERREPTYTELVEAFDEAGAWLAETAEIEPSFDGGALVFAFSGHGRPGDGTLVLPDSTYFSADDFLDQAVRVHRATGSARLTRLVLLLDSCYSGAFLAHVVSRIRTEPDLGLDTEYMLASSHPDEMSWEAASLGHGLSTYCFSLREASIGSEIGVAGLGGIRTWSVFAGPNGCSIATAAAQNPIVYQHDNIETCFQGIEDASWETEEELLQLLEAVRDDLYRRFDLFRGRQKSDLSDSDIETDMAEQLELARQSPNQGASAEDRARPFVPSAGRGGYDPSSGRTYSPIPPD